MGLVCCTNSENVDERAVVLKDGYIYREISTPTYLDFYACKRCGNKCDLRALTIKGDIIMNGRCIICDTWHDSTVESFHFVQNLLQMPNLFFLFC